MAYSQTASDHCLATVVTAQMTKLFLKYEIYELVRKKLLFCKRQSSIVFSHFLFANPGISNKTLFPDAY